MSIYEKYKISVKNDNLNYDYSNINLLELNSNSNFFKIPVKSPSYLFNNNSGFLFNSTDNSITYSANSNYFNSDVIIQGKIQASSFPSNVVILNDNNKIDSSYLPSINNFIVYNTNSIAIGTTTPIAQIQLNDGNAFFKNSRIGIGTFPSYYFHLNKVDTMPLQPAFVISSNSKHIIDIYTELGTIVINDDGSPLDTTAKLNVKGLLKTNEIKTPFFNTTNNSTIINNELFINKLNSLQSSIIINSNVDLILSNNSIGSLSSNLINLNTSVDYINKNITSNSNLIITSSNTIINNLQASTITTSNINILNIDALTSNPSAESVMDFKGKIRLYNDTENIIIKIFANDISLFLITKNNKLYTYSNTNNEINLLSSNFFYNTFKAKYNSYAYTYNNNLYLNGTLVLQNTIIRDFAISPLNYIFYLDNSGAVLSTNSSTVIDNFINLRKIETYLDNTFIILTNDYKLYYYKNNYSIITLPPNLIIEDMASGDEHTILQTNQGLWSFGGNTNNLTLKKGYSSSYNNYSTAERINYFNQIPKIKSIKVNKNSSIVIDANSNVYIFGNINKLYLTQQIYKISDIPNVLDFCCDNNSVFLLSYFNDLFSLGANNAPFNINLNDDFYGTSIKSKGSIIIGGDYFYKNTPHNSLLVQNFVGIGSNILYNSNYSMIVNGNINILGSIFNNDVPFSGSGSGTSIWKKNVNDIYYDGGNVGIGLIKPITPLHVNGNTTFESNVIIKGKLIYNNNLPINVVNLNNISYNGKFNINSLEVNDGILNINSIIPSSNILYTDNFQQSLVTTSTNTSYINPILINENSTIIISGYSTIDANINYIIIYKLVNNNWVKYPIINNDLAIGQSFAVSKDGSSIYIGAVKEKLASGTQTGGIYKYSSNLVRDPNRILSINSNNTYNYIGNKIACSGDGNILISTITNNNYKLFIKDIPENNERILDFFTFNSFHSSFNNRQIFIDANNDGSLIVLNYDFNTTSLSISTFAYFNLYIIKDYELYFLKFNSSFPNSFITSLSIAGFNTRIFISTSLGHHFIYDINFQDYKIINYNSTTIIKYFDIQPSYYFYKSGYKGVLSKNGKFIHFSNNSSIIIYKYNSVLDNWDERPFFNIPPNTHSFSLSMDANGYNLSMSIIKKISDTNSIDDIQISNYLFSIYKNQSVFNYNYSNLVINTDVFINSNMVCKNLIADGSNVYNVQTNNLVNNYNQNGIMYSSNNLVYSSSNIIYNEELKRISFNINSIFNCNINCLSNISNLSNISTTYGDIISGKGIISTSNIIGNSNIVIASNISSIYGDITSGSNITANNSIISSNNITAYNRIVSYYDIIAVYGNIRCGLNLISSCNITAFRDISTTKGNIIGASNLYITSNIFAKNIYGNLFFGDGSNLSNINPSNLISPVQVDKGGTGRNSFNLGEILIGSGSNNINSFPDFNFDYNSKTLNLSNINISSNLILNGSNFSNLNFTFQQILGVNTFDKGGLGFNQISKSNLIFANENNSLKETSNLRWDDANSNLLINGDLIATRIFGDGCNISNLRVDFQTIGGIVPFKKGGLGFNTISKSNLIFANEDNQVAETSNIRWDNSNSNLFVEGSIYAPYFYGDGYNLSNLKVDFQTIGGIIPFNKGGLGFNQISKYNLIFADDNNSMKETSNLRWDDANSNLLINGYIFGDGSNLSNINPSNLISPVQVDKGGTGRNSFNLGEVLIGSGSNYINSFPDFNFDYNSKTLNLSNINISSNLILNGSNFTNLNFNFEQITGINTFDKGGLGFNQISKSNLIFANDYNSLKETSNLRWDDENSNLLINGYIFGDGSNITNLNYSNITGIIGLNKGGLGFNQISKSNLIFANDYNSLKETSNLRWDDANSNLLVNGYLNVGFKNYDKDYKIKVDGNIYVSGNVIGLSDINFKKNIEEIENPLDKIEKLRGVYFNYKNNDDKRQIGMIAQEVEEIIPEVVYETDEKTKAIAYNNIIGLLIEGIKELSYIIKSKY